MRAPEERHLIELFARAEDVSGGGLALTLGDHPVLDANRSPVCGSGHRAMSPAAKMPGTLDSSHSFTDDAAIHRQPCLFGESERGLTPTPMTTMSAGSCVPSSSVTRSRSIRCGLRPR